MSYRKVPAGNQVAFIVTSQVQCGGRRENKQNQLPAWTFLYDVDSKQRRNLATALTKPFQTFKLQTATPPRRPLMAVIISVRKVNNAKKLWIQLFYF